MDGNTILIVVGSIVLGIIVGYLIAKLLEKNKASKLIKDAKRTAGQF